MIVLAQQSIGPYIVQVEQWEEGEIGLSITHDSFDHRVWFSADEASNLFDFLLLHMRHFTTPHHTDNGKGLG